MAEFLGKERVSVGSTGSIQQGQGLAQDLSKLFSALGTGVSALSKSRIAESEDAGTILARDSLVKLRKLQGETKRKAIENPNDFDFEGSRKSFDIEVQNSLLAAQDKFGKDSPAYKSFEAGYLLKATSLSEDSKTALTSKQEEKAKNDTIQADYTYIATNGNYMGEQNLGYTGRSMLDSGVAPSAVSTYVADTLIGDINSSAFNWKSLLGKDGKPIKAKVDEAFAKFTDSAVGIGADGSVISKHSFLNPKDVARIKSAFESKYVAEQERNSYNRDFFIATQNYKMQKDGFKPNSPEELEAFQTQQKAELGRTYGLAQKPSIKDEKSLISSYLEMDERKKEFNLAYKISNLDDESIGSAIQTGSYAIKGTTLKVNTEDLKRLTQNNLDAFANNIFKKNMSNEKEKESMIQDMRFLIKKEQVTGVQSPLLNKITTDVNNITKANTVEEMITRVSRAKLINISGRNSNNTDINMRHNYLQKIDDVLVTAKDKPIETVRDEIRRIKINENGEALLDKNYLSINTKAFNAAIKDNSLAQTIFTTNWQGIWATNVDFTKMSGQPSQEVMAHFAKLATRAGDRIDFNMPLDSGRNLEVLQKYRGHGAVIGSPIGSFNLMVLPTIDGAPIEADIAYDSIKAVVEGSFEQRGVKLTDFDFDDVVIEPKYNARNGTNILISYKGRKIQEVTGEELTALYSKLPKDNRTDWDAVQRELALKKGRAAEQADFALE